MTISDKIRIYELSRDLNLENKDILDAAQKLSISVKSHSSSISAEDAKKIKNLINNKNPDKKILSINKPSITKDHKEGIMFNKGMGRSAYICMSKKCYSDSKIKKKLQKALKTYLKPEFIDIFEKEIVSFIYYPNKGI